MTIRQIYKHPGLTNYRVYTVGDRHIVHTPSGRGEELRVHLHLHRIDATVSPPSGGSYDRVEVPREVDSQALQAILDQCKR